MFTMTPCHEQTGYEDVHYSSDDLDSEFPLRRDVKPFRSTHDAEHFSKCVCAYRPCTFTHSRQRNAHRTNDILRRILFRNTTTTSDTPTRYRESTGLYLEAEKAGKERGPGYRE